MSDSEDADDPALSVGMSGPEIGAGGPATTDRAFAAGVTTREAPPLPLAVRTPG